MRRPQFRLRTLLGVVAWVAVTAGLTRATAGPTSHWSITAFWFALYVQTLPLAAGPVLADRRIRAAGWDDLAAGERIWAWLGLCWFGWCVFALYVWISQPDQYLRPTLLSSLL